MEKVLITGGSGLLGKEIIHGFLEKNCKVYFTSTSLENANKILKIIKPNKKKNCQAIIQKFSTIDDIDSFIKKYRDINFNVLINNARDVSNLSVKNKDIKKQFNSFNVELFLAIHLPYFLATKLNQKKLKNIVNISSMYGIVTPNENLYNDGYESSPIHYGVSKSAQIQLTKELAVRMAKKNIRVNSIAYGGFEGRVNKKFIKKYSRMCPMGRMLKPTEVFEPIWFLCSSQSSGATGHNLVIDGGWTIW
jgi:NAD(P)-dependent dehydrogenase (short-subunit alcohol dehydrogenase family)